MVGLIAASRRLEQYVFSEKVEQQEDIVVIDSGHGGNDPGKIGVNGAKEKEINLFEQHIQTQQVQPKEEKKKPRPKPRDTPSIKRNNHLRNCIDPIAPPFDKGILSCLSLIL